MNFTSKDTKYLKESYYNFLQNLKQFILENKYQRIEKIVPILHYLLENSYFTDNCEMILTSNFSFLEIPSNLEQGIQVMYGICCCRHANTLQKNIMHSLGYEQAMDSFYFVDENNIWHKKENGFGSNHLVTSIYQENTKIIFDSYNGFSFKQQPDGSIILIDEPLTPEEKVICSQYSDQKNIKNISKVLKKYYCLNSLGINHIYEEEIYGIS